MTTKQAVAANFYLLPLNGSWIDIIVALRKVDMNALALELEAKYVD